ncbi:Capreomycidine synthase [Gimesia alba]|uniref:Aminotransferase n=1 Tax=Gimesia alba TaxID=2527973 RepID=A0A517RHP0_9PLAN|nr:pyridoxal phosphate-dependent aminotransferase [Gimesia alba]QDT43396.1 Capreomycidine synthase [Gimesia alba]
MELPAFPLVQWFAAAEGRFEFSLSHSDCEPLSVSDILGDAEQKTLANLPLGYGTFAGLEELRQSVARQYATLKQDDVLIFGGASEVIYTFMRTNLNPGDEVVIQAPIFNSLKATAQAIGCQIIEWRPTNELTCEFDVSTLIDLCNEQTKLIVFNFPHNPSGQMISEDELISIVETAQKYDAMIFSDEQFRLLELPESPRLPPACDVYDKAVSVAGVSKTLGLGGLRIGWLATRNRDLLKRAREYRYYTTEMTNTPCQMLAAQAMKHHDEILTRNRKRIIHNLKQLQAFCLRHKQYLDLHPPQAGPMAVVEQTTSFTSTEFCQRLLDEQRVMLVPGEVMGISNRLLRIGLGRDDFSKGLNRLETFLQSMPAAN